MRVEFAKRPRKETANCVSAGGAKFADKHLASTIRCVDDEIIGWLQRREQRRRGRVGMPGETKSKGRPFRR